MLLPPRYSLARAVSAVRWTRSRGRRHLALILRRTLVVLAIVGTPACTNEPALPASTVRSLPDTTSVDPSVPLSRYLEEPNATNLEAAVAALRAGSIEVDELSTQLHGNYPFEAAEPGRASVAAPIGFNQHRTLRIRTPEGYDPALPYPAIVAYHTWGGTGDRILDRLEVLLGDSIEEYVVAAPDDYRQSVLDAPAPISSEHVAMWRHLKTVRHIDSDRVYLVGYSLGGETVMTTTVLHGTHVAGAIAMANTFAFPSDVPDMWRWFARNMGMVPILHVWGAEDTINIPGLNGRDSPARLVDLNRRLVDLLDEMAVDNYTPLEMPGIAHSEAHPPAEMIVGTLANRRLGFEDSLDHTFRHIHQAHAGWVEGHEWSGDQWLEPTLPVAAEDRLSQEGVAQEAAAIEDRLGRIVATVSDNQVILETGHLSDVTVWLTPDLVDFATPLTLVHNGTEVFSGEVQPDIGVSLAYAARWMDFDRLVHAGIRITNGAAEIVRAGDGFPSVDRGIWLG